MIHRYDTVPSTMTIAASLAANGAPHGTTVVADEQTAGQGRLGRTWHSPSGINLYFTTILRFHELKPAVTMAVGVAVADAIAEATGIQPDLRWPNDVMIADRKLAGILAQYESGAVLVGIGINVNQPDFPPDLEPIATSLRIATGRDHEREALLQAILKRVIEANPDTAIADFTRRSSYAINRRVQIATESGTLQGVTAGLDDQGFLRLREDNGKLTTIYAGGVRPCS
jgi:BirA family biotin operon repressor/biotin-[acetyl-CoA-carboxylase] ligase